MTTASEVQRITSQYKIEHSRDYLAEYLAGSYTIVGVKCHGCGAKLNVITGRYHEYHCKFCNRSYTWSLGQQLPLWSTPKHGPSAVQVIEAQAQAHSMKAAQRGVLFLALPNIELGPEVIKLSDTEATTQAMAVASEPTAPTSQFGTSPPPTLS